MAGQIDVCRHDSVAKPNRLEFIQYARGHIVAAASARPSPAIGRPGITAATKRIKGPTRDSPSTGVPASNGRDVSIIAIDNAERMVRTLPRYNNVRDVTTL